MIYHKSGHSAVDAYVFAGNEPGFFCTQIHDHVGDVERVSDPSAWLLGGVRAFVDLI